MSVQFPAQLDTLTNPAGGDYQDAVLHSVQHSDANDAIEALEAKVGKDGSAVTTSLDYKISNAVTMAQVFAAMYPVGSVYTNATVSTNPATLLGFGTWVALSSGQVLVGVNTGDADFHEAGHAGGSKLLQTHSHTGTTGNPSANHTHTGSTGGHSNTHTHGVKGRVLKMVSNTDTDARELGTSTTPNRNDGETEGADQNHTHSFTSDGVSVWHTHDITTASAGSGGTENLQPYICVYFWKRTA